MFHPTSPLNNTSAFPFGIPQGEDNKQREQVPSSSSSLDIPEFLNPKNRL